MLASEIVLSQGKSRAAKKTSKWAPARGTYLRREGSFERGVEPLKKQEPEGVVYRGRRRDYFEGPLFRGEKNELGERVFVLRGKRTPLGQGGEDPPLPKRCGDRAAMHKEEFLKGG